MMYLVTTDSANILNFSPQQTAEALERAVLPTLETFTKLKAEKKILAGGSVAGQKAHAFIVEAASNDEVAELIEDLPLWGAHTWTVTPLESWEHHTDATHRILKRLKAASK